MQVKIYHNIKYTSGIECILLVLDISYNIEITVNIQGYSK